MIRQISSNKMFGMLMVAMALLLVACGNGDGDADPTATSSANEAVPTLPADVATAEETSEISEEDLTVTTPNVPPATAAATQPAESTPAATRNDATTVATTEAIDATASAADIATPESAATVQITAVATDAVVSTPAEVTGIVGTPAPGETATVVASTEPATVAGTATATTGGGTFNTAGDGTGGSGQPGERGSNTEQPEASPAASPVAAVEVQGCEITNVPPFEGETADYVTNAEVFFRQGPGGDCATVYETPLGEGQTLVITGGPVSQAADGSLWVQVEVDGVTGWVSFDFVEPAG